MWMHTHICFTNKYMPPSRTHAHQRHMCRRPSRAPAPALHPIDAICRWLHASKSSSTVESANTPCTHSCTITRDFRTTLFHTSTDSSIHTHTHTHTYEEPHSPTQVQTQTYATHTYLSSDTICTPLREKLGRYTPAHINTPIIPPICTNVKRNTPALINTPIIPPIFTKFPQQTFSVRGYYAGSKRANFESAIHCSASSAGVSLSVGTVGQGRAGRSCERHGCDSFAKIAAPRWTVYRAVVLLLGTRYSRPICCLTGKEKQ